MNRNVLPIAIIALLGSNFVYSDSIYKCVKADKAVMFTNRACPANTEVTLIHKETEEDIKRRDLEAMTFNIKRLIAANQLSEAKEYAIKNNLFSTYHEQLVLFSQQKMAEEKEAAELDRQQKLMFQQQQLNLQQQQLAIEKSQLERQQTNNQPYNSYPYFGLTVRKRCRSSYCSSAYPSVGVSSPHSFGRIKPQQSFPTRMNPPSSGGMNPPMSFPTQMNPPRSVGMNPPQSFPVQNNPRGFSRHK